jgi:hypothetical protein
MIKRTSQEWQTIMCEHAKSAVSTREFCRQHNIHVQTFYSKRHAMGLATPMKQKVAVIKKASTFIQANVVKAPTSVVVQTRDAQVSLSTQCDPLWLAALLKGLAA